MCSDLRKLVRRLSRLCDEARPRTFVRLGAPRLQKSPRPQRPADPTRAPRHPNLRKALFMNDLQYHDEVDLNVDFLDTVGAPAPVENIEVISSNTDVLEVVQNGDRAYIIRPTGAIAPASVTIRADAQVGTGEDPFFDVVEFNITAGRARRVTTVLGTPRLQDRFTPPATTLPPPTTTPAP